MASEPERPPADDDTVLVEGNGRAQTEEITQTGEQWPVDDLYYLEPDGEAPPSDLDASEAGGVPSFAPSPAGQRFPANVRTGVLLAALGVVAALLLGGVLLGLDDEPTAARQPNTAPSTSPLVETTPTPATSTRVELVDVEGMRLAEGREALDEQGMRVRVTRSPSERPRDVILSQAPAADSEIPKGTVVVLDVSRGDETAQGQASVTVPRVVGLSASAAVSAIRDAGLEARILRVSSDERRGTVLDQSPTEGVEVAEGSAVRLEVAKSAAVTVQRVEVPDVVGSAAATARSRLRAAGLTMTAVTVVSQQPVGTVVSQSPRAGTEVRKGATVKLTVSAGPAMVTIPDVIGLDEASARSELEGAGFQVRVTDESVTDAAQDGRVLRQTPASGSDAQDGAVVTLVVGRLG